MDKTEIIRSRGSVCPAFINIKTGHLEPWYDRHNTLSHDSTYAMASAFGGDSTYIPNRIGFVYGASDNPDLQPIGRDQDWASFLRELNDLNTDADVQVQSFSYSPSLIKDITRGTSSSDSSSDSSSEDKQIGCGVVFHAHSDSSTPGAAGSGVKFDSDTYIYQAVLLNKSTSGYRILARVSLIDGDSYRSKPDDFEVALDWTVKFF